MTLGEGILRPGSEDEAQPRKGGLGVRPQLPRGAPILTHTGYIGGSSMAEPKFTNWSRPAPARPFLLRTSGSVSAVWKCAGGAHVVQVTAPILAVASGQRPADLPFGI